MAALTADDVTVTISQRNVEDRPGFLRHVIAELTFGDGTDTYPSGGIPLPAIGNFGFKKGIAFGIVMPAVNASMFDYRYDVDNHKLLICGVSELSTPAAGATRFYQIPTTATLASTSVHVLFFGE